MTETVPTISYATFVNLLGFGLAGLVRIIREGTVSGTIDYSRLVIGEKSRTQAHAEAQGVPSYVAVARPQRPQPVLSGAQSVASA